MRISVAMATFNGSRFIEEQLASLSAQTVRPAELVVGDDGSTDDTLAKIRRFGLAAPFSVRIVDKRERLGFADNFLYTASQCSGELVAFCDQDDVWLPTKLEQARARMIADDSLLSMHRLTVTDADLRPVRRHEQGITRDAVFAPLQLDPHNTGWGNTMMFRRELATMIARERRPRQPGDRRPLSHDTWIYVLAAALGNVSHLAAPLILYRQHGANVFGVSASLRDRFRALARSPVHGHRERARFDKAMATLFREAAAHHSGPLSAAADRAARRFDERRDCLDTRIKIYGGRTLTDRVGAYRRAVMSAGEGAGLKACAAVAAKDLLLGVSGLSRLIDRSARPQ